MGYNALYIDHELLELEANIAFHSFQYDGKGLARQNASRTKSHGAGQMMSGSGVSSLPAAQRRQPQPLAGAATKASSPNRARHQIHRSITELTSPVRMGKHNQHHIHTSHHHHHRMSHHKRDRSRDDSDEISIPLSAAPVLQYQPRGSLEVPRSEGVTPAALSANPSRAGSILIPPGKDNAGGLRGLPAGEDKDEALRRAKDKTVTRTRYVTTTLSHSLPILLSTLTIPFHDFK